jgi:mono/diheme cytochrome c family protein
VRDSNGDMPPYKPAVLSDEDLDDIYAYLQALPQPRSASDIPSLGGGE